MVWQHADPLDSVPYYEYQAGKHRFLLVSVVKCINIVAKIIHLNYLIYITARFSIFFLKLFLNCDKIHPASGQVFRCLDSFYSRPFVLFVP